MANRPSLNTHDYTVELQALAAKMAVQTPMWICPITQKQFVLADTAAIEQHQKEVLAKAEAKLIQKHRTQALRHSSTALYKVSTLQELREWMLVRAQLFDDGLTLDDMPVLSVHQAGHVLENNPLITVQGGPANKLNTFRKNLNITKLPAYMHARTKMHTGKWYFSLPVTSPLGKKAAAYQNQKIAVKLTDEQRKELHTDETYSTHVKDLQSAITQLRLLKKEVASHQAAMETMRQTKMSFQPFEF